MKKVVKVAAAQIEVTPLDCKANLLRHREALDEITSAGEVDLVVFPELASSGFVVGLENANYRDFVGQYLDTAETIPGTYTDSLAELAREYRVYIVSGILEAHPSIPSALYNSVVLVGPAGLVGVYRKVHVVREEKHYFFAGDKIEVFPTELGNIGMLICADNSFPEMARLLALKGAEIICVPYARVNGVGADPGFYHSLNSCRAFENNCFVVSCNRTGVEHGVVFEGRSCICGPGGEFLARSDSDTEEMLIAELAAERLGQARMRYARFRDRRPDLYQDISG